jgi:hypothetical protein
LEPFSFSVAADPRVIIFAAPDREEDLVTEPLKASLEERTDPATQSHVREVVSRNDTPDGKAFESTASTPSGKLGQLFENLVAKRLGHRTLLKLATQRGHVTSAWR